MVKTRMAPSPTGEFHIGSMRTLLYNYAFAKKNNGKFVLRIEDTDRERYVEGSVERMLDVIRYCGLDWDEGPEVGGPNAPYVQSQRLALYKNYALQLVEQDHAYYCFCTPERLEKMRADQRAQGVAATKYDRTCLSLSSEQVQQNLAGSMPYTIRLKVPKDEVITFTDLILGRVDYPSNDLDDQILLKSDGFPTYHLGVVVDDHLMGITHILRGSEWLASTPKHILLYRMLGWEMPATGHLPNLKEVGANKKMSKRFGDVSVTEFLRDGYLPEALLNFIMLLGWNPGTEKELYSVAEFIRDFTVAKIHSTDLVAFDRERLAWLNGYYIRSLADRELCTRLLAWAQKWQVQFGFDVDLRSEKAVGVIFIVKDRMRTLGDFMLLASYFFTEPKVDKLELAKYSGGNQAAILQAFYQLYNGVGQDAWVVNHLDEISHDFIQKNDLTPKEAFMTLRFAVSGQSATPPIFDVLGLLGKDTVLRRIKSAMT